MLASNCCSPLINQKDFIDLPPPPLLNWFMKTHIGACSVECVTHFMRLTRCYDANKQLNALVGKNGRVFQWWGTQEKTRSMIHLKTSNDGTQHSSHYYSKRMRIGAKFNSLLSLTHFTFIPKSDCYQQCGKCLRTSWIRQQRRNETLQPQLDQIIEANSNTRLIKIYWCLPNEGTNLLLLLFLPLQCHFVSVRSPQIRLIRSPTPLHRLEIFITQSN